MNDFDDDLTPIRLRTMQIVAGTLLLGLLIFLGIVLFMVLVQNNGAGIAPPGDLPLLSLAAVVFFAVAAPMSFLVPRLQIQSALRQIASGAWKPPPGVDAANYPDDASMLVAIRQTSMIVGLALPEGSGFFACIAYLLEGQPWVLALVAVVVLLMLARFPTQERVRSWLALQADRLEELRRQGDAAGR